MKELKIYLAGAMSGLTMEDMNNWRIEVRQALLHMADYYDKKINVVNPVDYYNFEKPLHQTEREVMQFDLNHVKSSDLIIVNLENLQTSIGTIIELYEASNRNIPVLCFGKPSEYNRLHPWVKECITRYSHRTSGVTEYIQQFYMS